jgi:hypothetical protein
MNGGISRRAKISAFALLPVILIVLIFGVYLSYSIGNSSISTTETGTTSNTTVMSGVVTGFVTVGPSQPVCSANKSCNIDLTGYSLEFASVCPSFSSCQPTIARAPLSPSGHYSILLPAGNYSFTGLYPSCKWLGCSSAFPKSVVVEGGMQLVLDFNIDTGIR